MFFEGSRYEHVATRVLVDEFGREVRFKALRVIEPTEAAERHLVAPGERLDHIAHRFYDDPEQFWRICDANDVLWPPDLVAEPGRTIAIPHPEP